MKFKSKTWIIIGIAAGISISFLAGYIFGFSQAVDLMIKKAAQFVNIDRTLIMEYLSRSGL